MDRLSYADAVGHDSEEGVSTKALTSKMRELIGKPVKTLGDDENETLRLAFIFAEMWFDSLADANHNKGAEAIRARSSYRKLHEYRVKRWGLTEYEVMTRDSKSVTLSDLLNDMRKNHAA